MSELDKATPNQLVGIALEQWVDSLEDHTEGQGIGMLGDWLAVVSMVDVRDDGVPVVNYYLAMRDGNMLPHVAEGMLRQGLKEMARNTVED
jgi:hypothetical protein